MASIPHTFSCHNYCAIFGAAHAHAHFKVKAFYSRANQAPSSIRHSVAIMLVRSARRLPPSLVLLLAFLAFLGWELNQGMRHEERPLPSSPPPPPPPAPVEPEQKPHGEEKKPPRLALVTFVTEQRSYLYLSLRNKDRKLGQAITQKRHADMLPTQTTPAATAMTSSSTTNSTAKLETLSIGSST